MYVYNVTVRRVRIFECWTLLGWSYHLILRRRNFVVHNFARIIECFHDYSCFNYTVFLCRT